MLEKSAALGGYSIFMDKIEVYKKEKDSLAEAMEAAVKYCIGNNILKDFLEKHSSEVINMLLEWNADEALEVRYNEGKEEGFEMGEDKNRQYVLQLIDQGLSLEEIKQRMLEK